MEKDSFFNLETALKIPSYAYEKNGEFYRPTTWEIIKEVCSNINIFRSKKNWIGFSTVISTCYIGLPIYFWFAYDYSWEILLAGFFIGYLWESVLSELYLHRYASHRSCEFRNNFWRYIIKYCSLAGLPDEVHLLPHLVHHKYSDKIGDPYNASGGAFYCFCADINHQRINPNLSRVEYEKIRNYMAPDVIKPNRYEQYKKWGSVIHPAIYILEVWTQWTILASIYYLIGGFPLIHAVFGMFFLQTVLQVRNANFIIHGFGKKKKQAGRDFSTKDFSTNNFLNPLFGGNWHDHHHHFPRSANTGFMWWQIDWSYQVIKFLKKIGIVTSYMDASKQFKQKIALSAETPEQGKAAIMAGPSCDDLFTARRAREFISEVPSHQDQGSPRIDLGPR